jgi:hypothetical protein
VRWFDRLFPLVVMSMLVGLFAMAAYEHFKDPIPEYAEGPYQARIVEECVCRPTKLVTRRPR